MPFSQPAYEQDFADEVSLGEFRGFLERARSVLALPGDRGSENRAYEAVGLTVLGQSDILLVIWDGGASAGRGGTTEMIQTAIQSGLPIVNVDANGQAPTKIMWQRLVGLPVPVEAIEELHTVGLQELPGIVDALLRLPSEPAERKSLMRYLGESRNFRWMRPEFPLLQGAARARPFSRTDFNPPNPETLATDFAATFAEAAEPRHARVLAAGYGWADGLGVYYAQTFRGAFIMNFLLGAMAVVFAALSLLIPPKWLLVLLEIICIVAVLLNTSLGYRRDWHRRWIEAREVAERLRVALLLWTLAVRSSPFSREEPSWTGWYVRALLHEQGMRPGSLDGQGLYSARKVLVSLLEGQCNHHRTVTAPRMKTLNHVLEKAGATLFWVTLGVAVAYLGATAVFSFLKQPFVGDGVLKYIVAALSAALPALATAFYGIRVIGDFEGIAHRSERMDVTLRKLTDAIQNDPVDLMALRARARSGAEAMLGDVVSWHLAAESRTLPTP
jgi:hypothetical protein